MKSALARYRKRYANSCALRTESFSAGKAKNAEHRKGVLQARRICYAEISNSRFVPLK